MISVIIPMYNAEKYLRECLDSIVNQTYKDIEVLMINDGSSDNTELIANEYVQKYDNFRLFNKENGGQMSAWLLGIKFANGEYLGFVDSDDYIAPTMYEEMIKAYEKYDADLVMCNFYDLDKVNCIPRNVKLREYYSENEIAEIYNLVFPTLNTYLSMSRWDKLFKRDLYMENAAKYCDYISRTFEDRFIVTPYCFSCKSFVYVDKPLYYWRQLKVSSSRKPRPELCEIMENLYSRQKKMLIDKGFFEKYKDRLEVGKIDLIRSIISRNLCAKVSFFEKMRISEMLLTENNREIVVSHKEYCVGKFGKYIYYCCKYNSKLLMVAGSYLMNLINKKSNEDAFE